MSTSLFVAAEPFDCATCGHFVGDGDLIAKTDSCLLCESCAEKLPDYMAPTATERDRLIRHAAAGLHVPHDHACDEHDFHLSHSAADCRPTVTCPEGCVI